MTTHEVTAEVTLKVVVDETADLPALLEQIDGAFGTLDVEGFRFDCDVHITPILLNDSLP